MPSKAEMIVMQKIVTDLRDKNNDGWNFEDAINKVTLPLKQMCEDTYKEIKVECNRRVNPVQSELIEQKIMIESQREYLEEVGKGEN